MVFAALPDRAGRDRAARGDRHPRGAAGPLPGRGARLRRAGRSRPDNFSLALVIALAVVDGTLAIAARTFTRASAAAVLTPSGQLREGNAIINVGFTDRRRRRPRDRRRRGRRAGSADRAADRRRLVRGRWPRCSPRPRSLPQVRGEAAAVGERACVRASPTCAARAVLLRLLAMQALAFVFFTLVLPIEIVYAKETLDAGRLRLRRAAVRPGASAWWPAASCSWWSRGVSSLQAQLLVSTALIGGAYLGMAAAGTLPVACTAACVGGLGNGVQWVALMSAVQELTGESLPGPCRGPARVDRADHARHRLHPRRRDRGAARARARAS